MDEKSNGKKETRRLSKNANHITCLFPHSERPSIMQGTFSSIFTGTSLPTANPVE